MKKSTLILLFLLFNLFSFSKESKIEFRNVSNLDEAIELSKKENKLLFIDCYTKWCGPCKQMDQTVFTNTELANYYNHNFICIKADMEVDTWKSLAGIYPVYGYPSFLFIDSNRNLQHMKTGGCYVKDFIKLGETALDFDNNLFASKQKIDSGDNSVKTLRNFFAVDGQNASKNKKTIEFIKNSTPEELYSKDAWLFLTTNRDNPDSIFKNYIIVEYKKYFPTVGEKDVVKYIERIWCWEIEIGGKRKYKKLVEISTSHPLLSRVLDRYRISNLSEIYDLLPTKNNAQKLIESVNKYMAYSYKDGYFLDEIAYQVLEIYEKHKNAEYLKYALNWCDASLEDESTSMNLDTKANILFMLGDKKQAIEIEQIAIEMAKNGDDKWNSKIDVLERNLNRFKEELNKSGGQSSNQLID